VREIELAAEQVLEMYKQLETENFWSLLETENIFRSLLETKNIFRSLMETTILNRSQILVSIFNPPPSVANFVSVRDQSQRPQSLLVSN